MKMLKLYSRLFIFLLLTFNLIGQNELEIEGDAKINSLQGIGDRIITANSNGVLQTISSGNIGEVLTLSPSGVPVWSDVTFNSAWNLQGNSGTNLSTNFIGTTDNTNLRFKVNNLPMFELQNTEQIVLGSYINDPGYADSKVSIYSGNSATTSGFDVGITVDMDTRSGNTRRTLVRKRFSGTGTFDELVYADDNTFTGGSGQYTGYHNSFGSGDVQHGLWNAFGSNNTFSRKGVRNVVTGDGPFVGMENTITGEDLLIFPIGLKNFFNNLRGSATGVSTVIRPSDLSSEDYYGTYNVITHAGTGNSYAGYFNASSLTDQEKAFAAIFANGHVIANEIGGNNDFRIESSLNTHAFWLDADVDLVVFGSDTPDLSGNGANFAGTTINFAADFDNGTNDGTAIGIGSREFLLDGVTETNINNGFAPLVHDTYDLGYSTTERAWNDVYASNFVTISDLREKNDVRDLDYGLNEVLQMRPVSYTLKHDPHGETKLGLVAQDVLQLVKEVVKTHDYKMTDESTEEFKKVQLDRIGMNYQELIPVLIQAIKDQQVQMLELKELANSQAKAIEIQNQNAAKLEEKMSQLQKTVNSLKK